jgi:O-antigen/teichoic acid export membrane protein
VTEPTTTTGSAKRDGRSFAIDTIVVAVTQLVVRLRGLVLLPLIVKLLGTAAYGVWAQVVAFAMFLSALVSLNFHLPLVREIAADRSRAGVVYTTLFIATAIISGTVAAGFALVPGPIADALLDSREAARFIQLGLVLMVANNVRMLNVNLYRATGLLAVRSVMELVTTIGEIVGIIVLLRGGSTLDDVLVFMVAWNGGIALLQSIHCFAIAGLGTPQWAVVTAAIMYAVPLVPASFANFALDRMDRFVVGYYDGAEGVGIYAANYALGGLVMMAQTPFQMTLLPKVAELWEKDRARAARYIEISLMIFLTLAIPFIVGMPFIADDALVILGNHEIAGEAGWTTFLIAAGVAFWGAALIQAQVLYGARRTGAWGAITIAGTALNLVLNFVLVPWIGVAGAAAATFVAYGAIAIATSILTRSILPIRVDAAHLANTLIAAALMAGFLLLVSPRGTASLILAIVGAVVIYGVALVGARTIVPALRGTTLDRLRSSLR